MYNFLFRFTPKQYDGRFIASFSKNLDLFFDSLVRNGLIIDGWRSSTVLKDCYECRVAAYDMHSLDEENFSTSTRVYLNQLTKQCAATPQLEYVGINADLEGSCRCETPSCLVLDPDIDADTSPVLCCDCRRGFPLRRFRLNGKFEDFTQLLDWYRLYRSFRLQLHEGVGDTFAYMMLHRPDSALNKRGRALAAMLEESAGIVVYYYLMQKGAPNAPVCPECGRPWVSKYPDALGYDYCCQACRLVSNDPPKPSPYGN